MKRLVLFVIFAGFVCLLSRAAFGETIHVPTTEYPTIQSGIDAASSGDTVLVADGIYIENILFPGSKTITLISQNGAESTVVDGGYIGSVVTFAAGNISTLNGFTITNGSTPQNGGGVLCGSSSSPTITNCIITDNEALVGGGGIHCAPSSSPFIANSIIQYNSVTGANNESNGGGIHASTFSSPTISNCIIKNNTSNWNGGGLALNTADGPTIVNCLFSNNTAAVNGGAISFQDSAPTIVNCSFSNNNASGNGGAIACSNPLPETAVTNCILWEDSPVEIANASATFLVTYSDIQGGYAGTGNINADPSFVDAAHGDFHLRKDSPCIDAGDNAAPAVLADDFDGKIRPSGPFVDMGAYEYQQTMPVDFNGNGIAAVLQLLLPVSYGSQNSTTCSTDLDCPPGMKCTDAACTAYPHPSGSSPTLKGILYYGLQDIQPPPSSYSADADSVRLPYVSHELPPGYKDRIYIHDVPFTDYTKATLKATITDTDTSQVEIRGLEQNRYYFIRAFRFDENDIFTGEMSEYDVVMTLLETITPVDARAIISYDWGTDGFAEAFTIEEHGSLVDISHHNDASMGNYLRLQDSGFLFESEFAIDRMTYRSRRYISPFYDWELEINIRFGASGWMDEAVFGLQPGTQLLSYCFSTFGPHQGGSYVADLADMTNNPPGQDSVNIFSTHYPRVSKLGDRYPQAGWTPFLTPLHPDYDNFLIHTGDTGKDVFKVTYSADSSSMRFTLNGHDILLLGDQLDLPYQMRKWPQGAVPFPMRIIIEAEANSPSFPSFTPAMHIDVGDIKLTSAAPRASAGWAAQAYKNWSGEDLIVPAAHTLNKLSFWPGYQPGADCAQDWWFKGVAYLHPGYTAPFISGGFQTPNQPDISTDSTTVFSTAKTAGRTPFVEVPTGKAARYVKVFGLQQHGTLTCRVLDQDNNQIGNDINISGTQLYDVAPMILPENTATKVRIEVEIQYDNSAIDFTSVAKDNPENRRPNCPSIFWGFYFEFE